MHVDRFQTPQHLRVLVLTSPKAGSGKGREQIPQLERALQAQSVPCEVIDSIDRMRTALTASSEEIQTIVVAAGGDGTLSLAISLIMEADQVGFEGSGKPQNTPMVLPMPLGTENLVSREYQHSNQAEEVVQTLRYGTVQETDLGLCDGRVFLIMATAGFDAEVVRWLDMTRSGHIRRSTYLLPILRSWFSYRFPKQRVTVDGQLMEDCAWAMVFNLPQYGGELRIEPNADGADGMLDIILFRKGGFLNGLRYVLKIFRGRHLDDPSVIRLRGSKVTIESEGRTPVQIDGDLYGESPVTIGLQHKAIALLLPPSS